MTGNPSSKTTLLVRTEVMRGPGKQDAGHIQRIGRGDAYDLRRALAPAHAAQLIDGFRQRELLAGETGDESSAARGAARLHAAQRPDHIAPGQRDRLAGDDVAEDDSPAHQQLLGDRLGERIVLGHRCTLEASATSVPSPDE